MSLRNKLFGASLTLGLVLGFNAVAFAQQPQTPAQGTGQPAEGTERFGRKGGHREMGGIMRMMRELDLTDAQKQQAHAIFERFNTSTKTQREELHKLREQKEQGTLTPEAEARAQQLHAEMRESMKQIHMELIAILTPEQRAKLEQRQKEFKARRQEKREGRPNDQDEDQ